MKTYNSKRKIREQDNETVLVPRIRWELVETKLDDWLKDSEEVNGDDDYSPHVQLALNVLNTELVTAMASTVPRSRLKHATVTFDGVSAYHVDEMDTEEAKEMTL